MGRQANSAAVSFKSVTFTVVVIVTSLITGLSAHSVPHQSLPQAQKKVLLGYEGDTIFLDRASGLQGTEWVVQETLLTGDYSHVASLYLVPNANLTPHTFHGDIKSRVFNQPRPSRETGLLSYLYLLEGSYVIYKICIRSPVASPRPGYFYVFNNKDQYYAFIDYVKDGNHTAVYSKYLPIGGNNQSICTTMKYTVPAPSYYFFSGQTPGDISFQYNVSSHVVYYNHTNYTQYCRITSTVNCAVTIPSSTQEYTLLSYIHPTPPYDTDPPTTHFTVVLKSSLVARFHVMLTQGNHLHFFFVMFILFLLAALLAKCLCNPQPKNDSLKAQPAKVPF